MEETKNESVEQLKKMCPSLTLDNDNKIVLPTKEIPLMINGKEEMLTLRKLQSGQRRDLAKQYLNTKIVGQQIQGNMDAASYQLGLLSKVIIKAPFEITEKMISSFPENVLDYIYSEYSEWTGDSKKKLD